MMILVAALCLSAGVATAQEQTFAQGTNLVGIGIGFGGNLYSGSGYKKIPAFTLTYERSVKDKLFDEKSALGVGGVFGYTSAKWESGWSDWGYKYTNIIIGARGTLHYAFVNKLDTYTSLTLGYNIVSAKWTGTGSSLGTVASASGFTWMWNVGGRYYFTDKLAAMLELGYGFSILNIGVTYKF